MGRSMTLISTLFVVFLLFATGSNVVEARTCETPSHKFDGICVSGGNCHDICKSEGYQGGDCEGFRRRCMCHKEC
ncbi:Defensin-like protein [Euphorbia peplus]|nr:Defensin-like protein [Euphorbia peplus]